MTSSRSADREAPPSPPSKVAGRLRNAIDLRCDTPDEVIAWRGGQPVRRGALFADAADLADRLPPCDAVVNYCADRYRFLVAFVAALMSERVTLLPSDRTIGTLRGLVPGRRAVCCVGDEGEMPVAPDLATLSVTSDGLTLRAAPNPIIAISPDRVVVQVFTSGSTGKPSANAKTWGTLVAKADLFRDYLGVPEGLPLSIAATVPAQHMYGLECSVLTPLLTPAAVYVGRPFLPPAVAAALAAMPGPRVLVTTPLHLRALVSARQKLPAIECVVSATARLDVDLARAVEASYGTRLLEIYGFTEAGIVAARRTAQDETWTCRSDIRLCEREGQLFVETAHLPEPALMADVVELQSEHSFRLTGRAADLVNIAGKRASLAGLNVILNEIDGVVDGVFFAPDGESGDRTTRLLAFVVAPTRSATEIRRDLLRRIDPVFVPRRIHFVAEIPRNETGKITRNSLQRLLRQAADGAA